MFAGLVWWWRKPLLPWRQLTPFGAVVLGYLIYTGWPLLLYGFNWISYGNDDMANYCLAAERFLEHGYYDSRCRPTWRAATTRSTTGSCTRLQQIRPGSELTVAWVGVADRADSP